ncbi:MAG: Do family serine endopeptidase [Spirochaetia bacterium]
MKKILKRIQYFFTVPLLFSLFTGCYSQPEVTLSSLQESYRAVVSDVLPVVVQVETLQIESESVPDWNELPFPFLPEPPEEDEGYEEREYRNQGLGSGVIVRQLGDTYYVLTNNHVIEEATEIFISLLNGSRYEAELIGADSRKDIAIISFEAEDEEIAVARLGDSHTLQVGDIVFAVGNPYGFEYSVTNGIISALGRSGRSIGNINDFIQTDAAINQGNSGGALVNIQGEVIGLNTWIAAPSGGSIGLGFSIPINNTKRAIDNFIEHGELMYGWIGVSSVDPTEELSSAMGLQEDTGAFLQNLFPNEPAFTSGLRPGDIVIKIDGVDIRNSEEFVYFVGELEPDTEHVFTVIRDRETVDIIVEIGRRTTDQEIQDEYPTLWPGMTVFPLTEQIREELNISGELEGTLVVDIVPSTIFHLAGLRTGDVITSVDGTAVHNLTDFYQNMRTPLQQGSSITYVRNGQSFTIELQQQGAHE